GPPLGGEVGFLADAVVVRAAPLRPVLCQGRAAGRQEKTHRKEETNSKEDTHGRITSAGKTVAASADPSPPSPRRRGGKWFSPPLRFGEGVGEGFLCASAGG